MRPFRTAAAAAALIDSILAILTWSNVLANSARSEGMGLVGAALLVDAGFCIYGAKYAFYAAAVLSVLELAVTVVGGSLSSWAPEAVVVFSAVTLGLSVLAIRTEESIPEQANPMNLPVFG